MDGWIVLDHCIFCNGEVVQHATTETSPALYIEFCGGILPVLTHSNFVRCKACGLVMQSPRMTDERIDLYYSSGLYRETSGIPMDTMDTDELRRSKEVAGWLKEYGVAPQSHVDIGASRGYLLKEMGAVDQSGIESNKEYGGDTGGELGKYELVTAIHVLEHVTNPIGEIHFYKSLASDKILIEVPGKNCLGGALRFAHTYYYPPDVLVKMLEAAGLKILEVETEPNTRILAQA